MGKLRGVTAQDQHPREHEGEEDAQVQLVQRRLPKAGRRPPRLGSKMDKLQILQLELSFVNARASRACARLKRKVEMRCKSHLDRRRAIIQRIPGFWAKVVSFAVCRQTELQHIGLALEDPEELGWEKWE